MGGEWKTLAKNRLHNPEVIILELKNTLTEIKDWMGQISFRLKDKEKNQKQEAALW